jgi:hypothetical protein
MEQNTDPFVRDLCAKGYPHLSADESESAERHYPNHLEVLRELSELAHELAEASYNVDCAARALASRLRSGAKLPEDSIELAEAERIFASFRAVEEARRSLAVAQRTARLAGSGRVS